VCVVLVLLHEEIRPEIQHIVILLSQALGVSGKTRMSSVQAFSKAAERVSSWPWLRCTEATWKPAQQAVLDPHCCPAITRVYRDKGQSIC